MGASRIGLAISLAGLLLGIVRPAAAVPIKPGSYLGIWGLEETHSAIYHLETVAADECVGTIEGHPGFDLAPVPFRLERAPSGAWVMSWDSGPFGAARTQPLDEVQTPHGPALLGNFIAEHAEESRWGVVLAYLDNDLEENPATRVLPRPRHVNVDEGDFRIWTTEEGLAGNGTRVGRQTSDGFIWIGTTSGLSRFDGHDWVNFGPDSDPPLPETYVTSLAEDGKGRLLIGTSTIGILRFDRSRFTPVAGNDQLRDQRLVNLVEAADGSLWFTNADADEICRLHPDGTLEAYDMDAVGLPRLGEVNGRQMVSEPAPLPDGRVGVQGPFGLRLMDLGDRTRDRFLPGWRGRLFPCSDGSYWHCCWGWAARYHSDDRQLVGFPTPGLEMGLCLDPEDRVWLAGPRSLFRCGPGVAWRFSAVERGLTSDIGGIFADRDGHIWVLSFASGVGRLRVPPLSTDAPGDLANHQPLTLMHDAEGRLHVAARDYFAVVSGESVEQICLSEEFVRQQAPLRQVAAPYMLDHQSLTVAGAEPGEVWYGLHSHEASRLLARKLGVTNSLPILARRAGESVTFHGCESLPDGVEWVQSIAWTRDQGIWAATEKGVLHLTKGELRNWNDDQGIPRFEAICAFRDHTDTVWLGGYGYSGFYRVNGTEVTWFTAASDGLASDNVLCAYEDEAGALWVGGLPGLTRIRGDRIEAVQSSHELFQQAIHAVIEDGLGNLWFGTPTGIFSAPIAAIERFLIGELDELPVVRIGTGDGLPTDALQTDYMPVVSRSPEGRLFFSMVNALVSFDPAEMLASFSGPPVRITSVLGDTDLFHDAERSGMQPADGALVLPPAAGDLLRFQFSAIDFAYPERDRFHYRLRGVSEEWIDIGNQRQAWFSGLAPGDYRFEVRARNRNGAFSPEVAALDFTVRPHYYETWTFRIGIGLTVILLAFGLHRTRVGAFRRIEQLERQVAMDAERSRIARDMHDEIGSSLGQIRLLGELADKFEQRHPDSEGLARQIANLAHASSQSLRQIIWSLNPNRSGYDDLLDYLPAVAADFLAGTSVELTVQAPRIPSPKRFSPAFKRDLILMTKGVLANVVQHANASECVIEIALDERELTLKVSDNGCGFDPGQIPQSSFGLQSLKDRIEGWKGGLQVDSAPGRGTRITIRLPLP
ncbi:MAG: hypothetical protein H7A47_02365 [Verrucomicrobiales bacterium]|nr:hypothetical protein [Verrucomicrobiales bacterium]